MALNIVLVALVVLRWRSFWDRTVTPSDWLLGIAVAWCASWPAGIAIHEAGHAIAAKLTGASLTSFHVGLFDGHIRVTDYTSLTQRWFISLGAYPCVAAVGLAAAAAGSLAAAPRPAVRQILIMGGLAQVLGHLLLGPLFGGVSGWVDGSVIYDFSATPGLSWAAGVAHGFVLLETLRWWSKRLRWTLRATLHGLDGPLRTYEQAHRRDPDSLDARLRLANLCTSLGDLSRARRLLAGGQHDVAAVHLGRSRLALRQGRWQQALKEASDGLEAPETEDGIAQRLHASRAVALTRMDRHATAISAFAQLRTPLADQLHLRYLRSLAKIGTGDLSGGHADLAALLEDLPGRTLLHTHIRAQLKGKHSAFLGFVIGRAWRRAPNQWRDDLHAPGVRPAESLR